MRYFNEHTLEETFVKKGYVIVDFLNENELKDFLTLWENSPRSYDNGVFTSVFNWDPQRNADFSELTENYFNPRIKEIMSEWYVQGASFLVKGPGDKPQTSFHLHQDFNMIDENIAPSLGLWVALVDTSLNNGGLCVLEGSHNKFAGTLRGVNLPSLFLEMDDNVKTATTSLNIKAGQACIFAHSLFHGSLPNTTDKERIAIHAGLFPNDSTPLHYTKTLNTEGNEVVEVLEIDRTFYYKNIVLFNQNPKAGPYKLVKTLHEFPNTPTRDDVYKAYGLDKSEPKSTSFLGKIKNLLKL